VKHTNKIRLENMTMGEDESSFGGFYAHFEDGLDIQYEPKNRMFSEEKRTLWIHADPDEVNIAFFHDKFNLGFNSQNETGVWLSVRDAKLRYHDKVVRVVERDRGDYYGEDEGYEPVSDLGMGSFNMGILK